MTLAPDAPRWATEGAPPISHETVNFKPSAREFGLFAEAVAKRYSGGFQGIPAVHHYSIWNEPNHELFLKPNSDAPEVYRQLVEAAVPALRENGASDLNVLVGETAAVDRPGTVVGPSRFLRRWLCLDDDFAPLRGTRARREGCTRLERLEVDGYAHHPYGPTVRVPEEEDVVSLIVIRRLGRYLDRAAAAGRLPARLPIYSTEFGLQSNPPDPTVSTTLKRQAALLNEKEEFSFRYKRLRSYAQYLLYDDPPREGATEEEIWSGFQTGLRFREGQAKPSLNGYRLPIVVRRRGGEVTIWGRVRPGSGRRYVRIERRRGEGFVPVGAPVTTNESGFFEIGPLRKASYRYRAFAGEDEGEQIGTSRVAAPTR
jgi:hypothetical protein